MDDEARGPVDGDGRERVEDGQSGRVAGESPQARRNRNWAEILREPRTLRAAVPAAVLSAQPAGEDSPFAVTRPPSRNQERFTRR